jgi:outer membrane receptor protein involved in Fe transport
VEDPNRSGPLSEDRPHVMKMFGAYSISSRVAVSAYLRVQSGTPWAARGRDWAGAVLNYLEPAGSHRNPAWTNLDLRGSYRLPLQGRATISLEVRLMNVFDSQTRLSTDAQQFLDLQTLAIAPYFAPYEQPNPLFGTGNAFAPPRRLHLAASVSF